MKLLSAELINYIGIFNGMGIYSIYIDFTKCKNNIIMIKGDNGTGKSTLFKALAPAADNNNAFIPGKAAMKALRYEDVNGARYTLKFDHDIKSDGNRATTKVFISKSTFPDYMPIELNPSGNVTEAKEIVSDIFKLDANFMALSQLSSDDRGLADKTPAERKKFINSIIDTLEVYNNMYKTLSKRASLFKSLINSLNTKIGALGDEESIKSTLISLEQRISERMILKDTLVGESAVWSSILQKTDADHKLRDTEAELKQEAGRLESDIDKLYNTTQDLMRALGLQRTVCPTLSTLQRSKEELVSEQIRVSHSIDIYEKENNMNLDARQGDAEKLSEKTAKLNSLTDDENYNDMKKLLGYHSSIMTDITLKCNDIKFEHFDNMTKDEYILGLNALRDIKEAIDVMKSDKDNDIINIAALEYILEDRTPDISHTDHIIQRMQADINKANAKYIELTLLNNLANKFDEIPKKCSLLEECVFVKDIVNAANQNTSSELIILGDRITALEVALERNNKTRINEIKILECINGFKTIFKLIDSYSSIICKLPNNKNFVNKEIFLQRVVDGYRFDEINGLYQYIDYGNMLDTYKNSKDIARTLSLKCAEYAGRDFLIEEISNDISKLNNSIDITSGIIEFNNNLIRIYKNDNQKLLDKVTYYDLLIKNIHVYLSSKEELETVKLKIQDIKSRTDTIRDCLHNIETKTSAINDIVKNHLTPLMADRDKLKHALELSQEYCVELEEYKKKYEKVETIKFYSSPTTGIQTIFMEAYMNKIIKMANELLASLFNGEYTLMPFIINENEFRIPCSGSGLMNDDISSMSTSQICMISMILSFALLYHSSTKYNILKLDEIDGGLDTNNRLKFIRLLDDIMKKLNCEQCIMISHNSEISLDNVDIILLKTSDNMMDTIKGNVIFRY